MKLTSKHTALLVALSALAALALTGCDGSGPRSVSSQMAAPAALSLAWSDEFDGTTLDMTKWNVETGYSGDGWGNDEWQNYTADPANLRVENGELVITARSNGTWGKRDGSITSARITTENKLNVRYGKISARIKVPESEATWPAFWALGGSFRSVGWPRCGEIDIMEVLNRFSDEFTTHATVHWWNEVEGAWNFVGGSRAFATPLSDDYHVYEAERTADSIIFRIDGITVYVRPLDATMSELADEFFLLLNVAIGGTHGADPTPANFATPQEMRVDWVRVHAAPGEWRDPPDPSLTHKGIYSETHINPSLPPSGIINTIDWSADWAASDTMSTVVPPREGAVSMSIDYRDVGAWGGGPVLTFDGGDFRQFAGLTTYNTLVFSIDTSKLAGFYDLGVEIQDAQGQSGTAALRLKNYMPTDVFGNWKTYSIPLNDFNAANPTTDLTNVNLLMFLTPINDAGNKISGDFYLDDIHLADNSTTERGILSEQFTVPAVRYVRGFSTSEWGSSPSIVNLQSTEATPFEGSSVLTVDFDPSTGPGWGGVVFEFADANFTAYSSLATYNALVFSLNTAGFPSFADLVVEIQDGAGGKQAMLSSYTPIDNGDWQTYEIPLADFGGVDLTKVMNLLFVNPVDGGGAPAGGKFHLDDIHLATRTFAPPPPPGPAGIYTETYLNPLLQSTITTNAILGWGGSSSTLTVDSTAVSPVEGTFVLTYEHQTAGEWGGVVFEFAITDFTGGGIYDRLVFSLNTAGFSGFDDLQIELQDDEGTGAPLMLSRYTPQISGDWHSYEIPLTDFSAAQTAFDIDKVLRLLFFNPVDTNDVLVPGTFHLDNIYLAKPAPPPPPPPAAGPAGIYSETNTNPTLQNSVTTNAILGWGGSGSTLTVNSTAVTPAEGTYVITYNHFADGDKWGGVVFEFQNIDFTDGGKYDRLVFSLNTASFAAFDDLQVELQDDQNTGAPLLLSAYTPAISGDWHTYEIPFADFSAAQSAFDIDKVQRLLFFNPVDAGDALVPGTFHLDNIYLDSAPSAGFTGIYSETYTNPMVQNTVITTNAILGWGGSGSTLTVDSTSVTAAEGTYVITYNHFADGDKWGGVVFEFAITDFTDGGNQDTLVFSLNTAGFTGFAELQVELQDDENTGAPLFLSKYTPDINGDWHTYEIPLTDFSAAQTAFDVDKVGRLLFFNPADSTGAFIAGVFHVDHIYLR